jgi:hypothetical protein
VDESNNQWVVQEAAVSYEQHLRLYCGNSAMVSPPEAESSIFYWGFLIRI